MLSIRFKWVPLLIIEREAFPGVNKASVAPIGKASLSIIGGSSDLSHFPIGATKAQTALGKAFLSFLWVRA